MPRKLLWAIGWRKRCPALHELLQFSLGLFGRACMESEAVSMSPNPLSFLMEIILFHLRQSPDRIAERVRTWDQSPGSLAQDDTAG
jgi:hypothetical protein